MNKALKHPNPPLPPKSKEITISIEEYKELLRCKTLVDANKHDDNELRATLLKQWADYFSKLKNKFV